MASSFGIVVFGLLILGVFTIGFFLPAFDLDFEGDALAIRSSLSFNGFPARRVPFEKIRKIEVYRPRTKAEQLGFLAANFFAGAWYSTLAGAYVIVKTKSAEFVLSPPDPEGFAQELEARRLE